LDLGAVQFHFSSESEATAPNGNTATGIGAEMFCISFRGGQNADRVVSHQFREPTPSPVLCFAEKITEVPPSPYPFGFTRLGQTDGIQ